MINLTKTSFFDFDIKKELRCINYCFHYIIIYIFTNQVKESI